MTPPTPKKTSSGLRPTRSLMRPPTGCSSIRKIRPSRLIHVAVSARSDPKVDLTIAGALTL